MRETLMIRIGRNPAVASLRSILFLSATSSLVLAVPLSQLFDNQFGYAFGYLVSLVAMLGLIFGIVGILYRPFEWDPAQRLARFGRRTVPLDSITEAWRHDSTGRGPAGYLTYRFVSSDGPSVRVLVAGTPIKGLDQPGMAELVRFISALPNVATGSGNGLTEDQNAIVNSMNPDGSKSRVGRRMLIAELETVLAPVGTLPVGTLPDGTVPDLIAPNSAASNQIEYAVPETSTARLGPAEQSDRPTITLTEAAALERAWQADDEDAARFLAEHRRVASVARRVLFWLIVVAGLIGTTALVLAVVRELAKGSFLDSDTNDFVAGVIGPAILGGVLLYIGWCVAADADVRNLRRTATAWLENRDAGARIRGLPIPLHAGWQQPAPGTRLRNTLGFLGGIISLIAVVAGPLMLTEKDIAPAISLTVLVLGLLVLTLSVLAFVRSFRQRRDSSRQFVILGGWRLVPPDVLDLA